MKFALSSRQTAEYLILADEIRVDYKDREIIYDLVEKYPNKNYILEIPYYINRIEENNFQDIIVLSKLTHNLICRISHLEDIDWCIEHSIRWFYGMIIDKWEDFITLANTNTEYIVIGGDLFFDLPKVKNYNQPIRMAPNVANLPIFYKQSNLDFDITIVGDWFSPEEKHIYDPFIDVIEFENCTTQQERAMYRIWEKDGWPGNLQDIITNLKTPAEGRLLNPDWFGRNRLDCGRRCLSSQSACSLCFRQFSLANYEKLKEYKEEVIESNGELE